MLPLLQLAKDEEKRKTREAIEPLAKHFMNTEFKLTEEETTRKYTRGTVEIFYDRVYCAKTRLEKAGLIKTLEQRYFQITKRGLEILHENPPKIDTKFLKSLNIPEYSEEENASVSPKELTEDEYNEIKSPRELIEDGYNKINRDLSDKLLSAIMECPPAFFEKLIVDLMLAMGYGGTEGTGQVVGKCNDEGIDGIIKEDKLGLDIIYLQAKRWQKGNTIGRPELQNFVGSLTGKKCNKGVFITTSTFTKSAKKYIKEVSEKQLVFIDGSDLTKLMIEYNVGVSTESSYEIKKVNSDYFEE